MSEIGDVRALGRAEKLRIDALCDEFERALKAGRSPRIEEFVNRLDEGARLAAMRELLKVEIELRNGGDGREKERQNYVRLATLDHSGAQPPTDNRPTCAQHDSDKGSGRLEVRCPSCHEPTEVAVDTSLTDLTCSSCGSHFSLVNQGQATRMAPSLSKMGRFELIERLGVGSFGSVWKARDRQLDRAVAIKIPRAGGMNAEEQEKFFREARAAAQLRHPNIVSVYEVGRDGESIYIVSEFIRGVTLGDWLTGQQITNLEATELCAKIAAALHHAHEQGVVHRDLKPANIMMDYDSQPHLMDFGLARREVGEVTMTMDGQILGTPAYMSPEQADGEAHTADRRSDVYSLGVILFQLVTGELPFRGNARMLIKQVVHDEPPSPRKLNGNIKRDLETITLKCLEKPPAKRYQTAHDLAEELRRFLRGEPIQARPIRATERAIRWVRRNRLVSALAAAVVLVLLCGTIVSMRFAVRAHQQANLALESEQAAETSRRVAEARQKEAEAVTQFLVSAFTSPDPNRDGRTVTVAELLGQAEERAKTDLSDQGLTQAALLTAIGSTRIGLGQISESIAPLKKAMELRNGILGIEHPDTLDSLNRLASAYRQASKGADLVPDFEEMVSERRKILGDNHPETLRAMAGLASALQDAGKPSRAITLFEETLDAQRQLLGAEHPNTLATMDGLAHVLNESRRYDDTISLYSDVLAARRKSLGENHPESIDSMSRLAYAYYVARRYEQSIPLFEEILSSQRKRFGDDHLRTIQALKALAQVYIRTNRSNESIPILEPAVAALRVKLGDNHPRTRSLINDLANAYAKARRFDDAIRLYKENFAAAPGDTLAANNLGYVYEASNRLDDAIRLQEETLVQRRSKLGRYHSDTLATVKNLTRLYARTKRRGDGQRLFNEALEDRLFCVALDSAKHLGSKAISELVAAAVADDGRPTPRALDTLTLAELRMLTGKPESAEPVIRAAIQQGEGQVYYYKSLGWCLLAQGDVREAQEAFAKALGKRLRNDGTVNLENAEPDQVIGAFLFDRLSEAQFTTKFADTDYPACMPWFYIGQRREIAANKEGAVLAYKRCAELDSGEEPHPLQALATWRLAELTDTMQHDQN